MSTTHCMLARAFHVLGLTFMLMYFCKAALSKSGSPRRLWYVSWNQAVPRTSSASSARFYLNPLALVRVRPESGQFFWFRFLKHADLQVLVVSFCFLLKAFVLGFACRFAQFFINPLAKVEAMDREVQSVDSGKQSRYHFTQGQIMPSQSRPFP